MSEVSIETEEALPVVAAPETIADLKPKMKVKGTVQRLELYGAFIDIGVGTNALIHISQLSQDRVNRVSDVLNEGDKVEVWVSKVEPERNQIMVSMIEPLAVEWSDLKVGQAYTGTITRLENFGAFVDIGAEREGLVHVSELSHDYIKHPSEAFKVGDEVQVQVLGFNRRKRRIDLSIKALQQKAEPEVQVVVKDDGRVTAADIDEEEEDFDMPTAMELAMREAMGNDAIDSYRDRRRKKGSKKQRRRQRNRRQQDDILERTLHMRD
jgi:small subunit ribosomal protein S1